LVSLHPSKKPAIEITIKNQLNEPVFGMIVKVYSNGNEDIKMSNVDGICQLENFGSVDSIRVSNNGLPVCNELFVMNDDQQMDYEITMQFSHVNIAMKDRPWLVKGKKAYFYQDSNGRFDKDIFKRKYH